MIYLPPPQPILNKEIRISGDVEVHPTASLAPGVILQAASDSRIVVGADVCIGMGVIINACQGSVEIGDGAILGAGVLVIGQSKIGNNSCIGTSSTIFRQNITSMSVIEPGSIIGDPSRSAPFESEKVDNTNDDSLHQPGLGKEKLNGNRSVENAEPILETKPTAGEQNDQGQESVNHSESSSPVKTRAANPVVEKKMPVVGQVYINELLITLFPHKKESDSS
ncbi:MAG: hypothetical protein AAF298_13075 [Cyanobacteria bacterium P01_A01_bin.40]